jgi:hypothetical protein
VPATTEDVPLQHASCASPPAVHLSFTEVHMDINPNDISVYEDIAEGRYTPLPSADGDPVPLVDITSDQGTSIALKTLKNSNTQVKLKSLTTPPKFLGVSSPVHSPLEPRRLIFDDKIGKNISKKIC